MEKLKSPLTIRGDSLYCPLSLSADAYWNCLNDCHHCYLRRLNHVWGQDLRPADVTAFEKQLINGLKNPNPKSSMAWALKQKKTIRFGNKADPFQPAERTHHAAFKMLTILKQLQWSVVIQTMCTDIMMDYFDLIVSMGSQVVVQPIISPGLEQDWAVLERKRTSQISARLDCLRAFKAKGISVGVNGEPYIPGYHTVEQFEETLKRLRTAGVSSYNTYSFHFNDFVAKRLIVIGVDIEKIWYYNQDKNWRPILQQLIDLAKKYNVALGCPDFVNAGPDYVECTNTCCGVDVPNPTTFNVLNWKRRIQQGEDPERVFESSWDGVGDKAQGRQVFEGTTPEMFTLKDAGIHVKPTVKKGLLV